MLKRSCISLIVALFLLTHYGCALTNDNPNILAEAPYNQVTYVAQPGDEFSAVDEVLVTTRGAEANLLTTMPALYRRVLENVAFEEGARYVTDIHISSYTIPEANQVSYQDCTTEYYYETEPTEDCTGYGSDESCYTSYRQVQKSRENCTTKLRTEIRNVLYQQGRATILRK
jgi:hypothetical protein